MTLKHRKVRLSIWIGYWEYGKPITVGYRGGVGIAFGQWAATISRQPDTNRSQYDVTHIPTGACITSMLIGVSGHFTKQQAVLIARGLAEKLPRFGSMRAANKSRDANIAIAQRVIREVLQQFPEATQ